MVALLPNKTEPLAYDEIAGVLAGGVQTIVSHRSEQEIWISQVMCSGRVYGEFSVMIDGNKIATKRSGPDRNVEFNFSAPIFLDNGALIEVTARHYRADEIGVFEASIFGYRSRYAIT